MKIHGLNTTSMLSIKGIDNLIQKLNIGDKLSVQIVAVNEGELTLRLPNGTNVVASLMMPLDIDLGDFLELSVKNKTHSQVVLETVKNTYEETKTNEVINNLLSLKVPTHERNIEIGKALINQHMALNRQNFNKVISVLNNFEDMNIQKAAFVVSNSIESVEDGIEILKNAENNKLDISKQLNKLTTYLMTQPKEVINDLISNYAEKIIKDSIKHQNTQIAELIKYFDGTDEQAEKIIKTEIKQIFNGLVGMHNSLNSVLKEKVTETRFQQLMMNYQIMTDENVNVDKNVGIQNFLENHPKIKEQMISTLNDKQFMQKAITEYTQESPVGFKHHSENEPVYDKVRNFLSPRNIISEEGINAEIDVNKLYKELIFKLEAIEETLTHASSVVNKDTIFENVSEIRKNVDFINSINNLFYYFQLPINLNQKTTPLDLYIVKNTKSHNKINPQNATLFISLNTQNLGVVETLISVNNSKVDFNFRLDNDKTIEYFSKRQYILDKLLEEKGFTLNKIKFSINTKRTNVVSFEHLIHETKTAVKDVFDVKI